MSISSWALCLGIAAAVCLLTNRALAAAITRIGRNDRQGGFDPYYLIHDHLRRQQEDEWVPPKIEGLYEVQGTATVTARRGRE